MSTSGNTYMLNQFALTHPFTYLLCGAIGSVLAHTGPFSGVEAVSGHTGTLGSFTGLAA